MTDENKMILAKEVFKTLCKTLDDKGLKYDTDDEKLTAFFGASGDDVPMNFILIVDADRQLLRFLSPLPFKMSEDKRIDGAIATCIATYGLNDGSFDYDITDGEIVFRLTASFRESVIGEGLLDYMLAVTAGVTDRYNDQFLAIDKGYLSIADFIAKENE